MGKRLPACRPAQSGYVVMMRAGTILDVALIALGGGG
jgi:hypothetical protein